MIAVALLLTWTLDRVEPPWAVLVDESGRATDVRVADLPPNAEPGDRLSSLTGPVVEKSATRRARLARRLAVLTGGVATQSAVVQPRPMKNPQDHYFKKAKQEGFVARSVYKLEEIDTRMRLFRGGYRVLDLGAAPGSWLQYASRAVGDKGRVVGVDRLPVRAVLAANVTVIHADVFEVEPEQLLADGGQYHVVMSDMAPTTGGNRFTDHVRSVELCERALLLADNVLRRGGSWVCKIFDGEDLPPFVAKARLRFERFKRIKPKGTRRESVELYIVGQGFRGPPPQNDEQHS